MILREMRPDEAGGIQFLATKNFLRSMEAPFVTKPKAAMVAELEGEVVGGFIYSIETSKKSKLGFIDFFFVDAGHMGQGIGRALCRAGVAHLWAQGCDYLGAVVRDDNVGSWAAFERSGFIRVSLLAYAKAVGFINFLKTSTIHGHGFSPGCNLYFATRPEKGTDTEIAHKYGFGQLFLYLTFTMLLILISTFLSYSELFRGNLNLYDLFYLFPPFILSGFIIFFGVVFIIYVGTFFSRRKWRFQFTTGGGALSLLIALAGFVFPLVCNFYPEKYENTKKFRRDMAITAILPWVALMVSLPVVQGLDVVFLHIGFMDGMLRILLLLRCIPLFAVSLGASRVFVFSKILWMVMVIATIGVLAVF